VAFGLESFSNSEVTAVNFFPVALTKKLAPGSNCRMIKSEVNPDDFLIVKVLRLRNGDNHMQPEFAFAVNKVSRIHRIADILTGILRDGKAKHQPVTGAGCEIYLLLLPVKLVGMQVVPGRAKLRARLTSLTTCFFTGKGRLKRFGSFGSSLNNKVRNQPFAPFFNGVVSSVVKLYSVLFGVLPAILADKVKSGGELSKSMQEGSRLLSSGIQFQPYSSIHRTNILPYIERLVNTGYFCANRSKDYAAKRLTRSDIPLPAKPGSPLSHSLWMP
jgi:hypothetical protein